MITLFSRFGRDVALIAFAAILSLAAAGLADARPGGGSSAGSRGSRTYSAPPSTATAPSAARPMERSMTQPGTSSAATAATATAAKPRFGFGTGFFAGLLGAGLLGALMGHGFFGGLGGLASILGFILQVGLVVWLVSLAVRWLRRRQQEPALAGAGAGSYGRSALSGTEPLPGGGGAGPTPQPQGARDTVGIGQADYGAFEQALVQVQGAYAREDLNSLRQLATAEMVSYFADELAHNGSRGVVNRISDVKLLQGDLSEAWREGPTDYATVAMRYALVDNFVDRASGRVVDGGTTPTEAVEIWTFRRERGGRWLLSAIQQTG